MYSSGITQRGAQGWLAGGWFLPGNPARQQTCGHSSTQPVALPWHWCAHSTAWQCAPRTQHSPLPLTSWVTSGISCYKWTCNAGISLFSFFHKAPRKCLVIIDKHYFYLFCNIFPTLGQMSTQHQFRLSTSQKFHLSLANLRQILYTSANIVCIIHKDDLVNYFYETTDFFHLSQGHGNFEKHFYS